MANGTCSGRRSGAIEHTSDTPIAVSFDRGDGSTARKLLKSGTYRIGIDADEQRLDLFDNDDVPEPSELAQLAGRRKSRQKRGSGTAPQHRRVDELLRRLKTGTSAQTTSPSSGSNDFMIGS